MNCWRNLVDDEFISKHMADTLDADDQLNPLFLDGTLPEHTHSIPGIAWIALGDWLLEVRESGLITRLEFCDLRDTLSDAHGIKFNLGGRYGR